MPTFTPIPPSNRSNLRWKLNDPEISGSPTFQYPGESVTYTYTVEGSNAPSSPAVAAYKDGSATAILLHLNRRAFHRTVRAKYAAVAGFRTQYRFAIFALVVELARVHRHDLSPGKAALRTGQHGLRNGVRHRLTFPG